MTNKYNILAKPTYYNDIQFRSRLEARWAAFFDLMKWKYTYEPIDLNKWSPDFTIQTTAGNRFLVEVKPELYSDIELRLKIGTATDFAKGILIVTEMPFKQEYPNCIGLTSLQGKISNGNNEDDFEFCTSIIMNAYGSGNDIFNLCEVNEMILDNFIKADDFSTKLWSQAGNIVQFLKPKV